MWSAYRGPASQAAPGTLAPWAAVAGGAHPQPAEARLAGRGGIDFRIAQPAPPRADENLARAVGFPPSDRPGIPVLEGAPQLPADPIEPHRRSSAGAPDPAPAADETAPQLRPGTAATAPASAAGEPRIQASGETGDVVPGRTERMAGTPPDPAGRPLPPTPVVQLGIHVALAAARRVERLVVQLEPAALGRVEVRLDFTQDHRVSAMIAAERPETLEVLQRDSRALERGLQDAGLRLDQNALSFSLRQEQRGQERGAETRGTWPPFEARTGSGSGADRPDEARPGYWFGAHRVLDIRI